jgi:hypothetical protein
MEIHGNALAKPIEPGPAMPDRLIALYEPARDATPAVFSSYEGFRVTGNALKKLLGIAAHIGPIVYSSWSFCDVREGIPGTIGPRLHCSGPASLL